MKYGKDLISRGASTTRTSVMTAVIFDLCFDWPGGADELTASIKPNVFLKVSRTAVRASPVLTAGTILPTECEVEGFDGGAQDVVEDHTTFMLGLAFSYCVERDAPDEEQDND